MVAHLSQFFRNNFPQFYYAILVTMLSLEGHLRKVLGLLNSNSNYLLQKPNANLLRGKVPIIKILLIFVK